jgi:predicted Zn-dependent protease
VWLYGKENADRGVPRYEMKIAERTEDTGYRKIRPPLFGLEPFFQRQLWPARLALVVAGLVVAVLLAALFFRYGLKLYTDWHQTRLLEQASLMLQQGRFTKATQAARDLLVQHPDSLPALYILAEAAEKQNLEEAISWRGQIARLRPKDQDSQLNLVSAALRFGKLDLARKALDQIPANARDRAAFHVVAGWLAYAEGNFAEQEEQFAAAVKKEPENDLYQFNLAALQIHNAQKNAIARENLERFSKLAPYRTGALRALLNDAVERNDLSAADNFAQQLQMSQQVTFGDYLLCLNFYRKLDEKKFRLSLERVKPFAVKNPSDLASLMEWMNKNGLTGEVVKWIEKLPAEKLASPPTAVAVADTYASAKNWTRLKRWTHKGMWGESDYLRLAYQAIATRQLSRGGGTANEFERLWRTAEQATNGEPQREVVLARLASKWNLEKESEQLWLRIAENPPLRREALDALRRLYREDNDTTKLYDVLQRLHESSPNEAPITADFARLGLNLERNIERSHELAKESHDRAPNEINCAVTYAFSLYRLGRNGEALAIIQALPADQLHDPHAAVYAALLLAAASQVDAAKEYVAAADDGIYPEEKKVLDDARTKIADALAIQSPTISRSPAQLSPSPSASP